MSSSLRVEQSHSEVAVAERGDKGRSLESCHWNTMCEDIFGNKNLLQQVSVEGEHILLVASWNISFWAINESDNLDCNFVWCILEITISVNQNAVESFNGGNFTTCFNVVWLIWDTVKAYILLHKENILLRLDRHNFRRWVEVKAKLDPNFLVLLCLSHDLDRLRSI